VAAIYSNLVGSEPLARIALNYLSMTVKSAHSVAFTGPYKQAHMVIAYVHIASMHKIKILKYCTFAFRPDAVHG